MPPVQPCDLPPASLLFGARAAGGFADCYVAEVEGSIPHAAFVEAFYTTRLFKVERAILKWVAARPSTDAQVRELAAGTTDSFAAWRVEGRSPQQILLADFTGRTRSWLMVEPVGRRGLPPTTRLYFGSGVGPRTRADGAPAGMGLAFNALLGFHKLYSRLLLGAAVSRLRATRAVAERSWPSAS